MNDETYSLDKLLIFIVNKPTYLAITVEWLSTRDNKKGFDQNSLVRKSDCTHLHTDILICRDAPYIVRGV